jgi:hypothetical protein
MMAWHIFRKDLALLWPLAVLSALVQFGLDAMMFASDRNPDAQALVLMARLVAIVEFMTIAFVIALGVQQEPIPGTRQDWLVRPIRRIDLLLAKLLFVAAAVHLPMLVGDVSEALAHGFAPWPALSAALARTLLIFVGVSVPALAIAAMTRNMTQFVGFGLVYFIGIAAATILLSSVASLGGNEQATNPIFWTGVAWVPQALGRIALAVGAVAALGLLYLRRRIGLGRSIFAGFALLSVLSGLLPWGWIFGIQQAVAAAPAGIGMAVDQRAPRYAAAPGENADDYSVGAAQVQLRGRARGDIDVENKLRHDRGDVAIYVPIRLDGLAPGTLPWVDRATVTLRAAGGQILFAGRGDDWKYRDGGLGYQVIRVPALLFERVKDQPLALALDYSFTLLAPGKAVAIPALGADRQLPGIGRCASGRDSDGNDVALRCVQTGQPPSCVEVTLEAGGVRNPATRICAPDYAPFSARFLPDALSRFEVEAPFRDRLGLGHYPVSGPQLEQAQLLLTAYAPRAHLTRRVAVQGLRLSSWTVVAPR